VSDGLGSVRRFVDHATACPLWPCQTCDDLAARLDAAAATATEKREKEDRDGPRE
jgi:hypothetical protein